jgi:hypothetical protein
MMSIIVITTIWLLLIKMMLLSLIRTSKRGVLGRTVTSWSMKMIG